MQGVRISESRNAIRSCIQQMNDDVRFSYITFDNTAKLQCGLTDAHALVMSLVDRARAQGGTNIAAGLSKAIESLLPAGGTRVVILLSDGQDGSAKAKMDAVLSDAAAQNIVVYTIGLRGCDVDYLRMIADRTGGQFAMVSDVSLLESTYTEIQNVITHGYLITYQVSGDEEDRSVMIQDKNSLAETSRNYTLTEAGNLVSFYVNGIQETDYFRQIGGTDMGR